MASLIQHIFRGQLYMVDLGEGEGMSVQRGRRPCVVVSNNIGNRFSSIINVCVLTTSNRKDYPMHVKLTPNEMNKLKESSTIMAEQIRTVPKERLMFKIGALTPKELDQLDRAMRLNYGL